MDPDVIPIDLVEKRVPDEWHFAKIAAIFKKGDPCNCLNYRPISLLSSSYKLFALILLNRLRKANVDDQIWPTQFGFRNGARVTDALFMARRFIDKAHAVKNSKLVLLALLAPPQPKTSQPIVTEHRKSVRSCHGVLVNGV